MRKKADPVFLHLRKKKNGLYFMEIKNPQSAEDGFYFFAFKRNFLTGEEK